MARHTYIIPPQQLAPPPQQSLSRESKIYHLAHHVLQDVARRLDDRAGTPRPS